MSDPSATIPARLFTTFGTVLYVDGALGQLRHGSIEESPANLFFELDAKRGAPGRQGRLIHEADGTRIPLVCDGEACRPAAVAKKKQAGQGTWLELIPLERGLIGFTAGGMFLAATPDGKVDLSRPWCSAWECFLASEDWCTDRAIIGEGPANPPAAAIDKRTIAKYGIDPVLRMRSRPRSRATRILVYGYPQWSHGRVYYDVSKHLYERGYIVDIINWQADHSAHIGHLLAYYDLVMTAPDGVSTLADRLRVPYEKIIAVSHHEMDIRMLIEQKGIEVFDRFAAYGVVSYFVYCASLMRGVTRAPQIASVGITYDDFHAEIPERLATVGYASSMSVKTYGVEWKRGELAEAAARQAGLEFRKAGSTGNQISFHDMPDFYLTVDAILTSSISEAAQLPVMEGAAAGRLVIGTPVGHFPLKAYQGGGIIAPVEAGKFTAFAAETLRYYKENPAAYVEKCRAIQEAARQFDWQHVIGEWVELIEAAKRQAARSASSYLFTTHGTVLFVDAATGELRHGPPRTSPANAVLRREGVKGRLMHDTGKGFRPILRQPDGQRLVSAPGDVESEPPLEIVDAGPGLTALREGGCFLSSEPEGAVTQHRPEYRWWEHFRLSPSFDRKALAATTPGQSGAGGTAQAPPFYLLAWGYTPLKGGVVAMHLLCHYLNLIGHEAYLVPDPFPTEGFVTQPGLRTPVLTTEIAKVHDAARRDPIAVYAEGGLHNKLICRRVIRYMMNMPGARGGNEAAAIAFWADPARRSDFVLRFYDAYLLPDVPSRVLHVPIVDQTVFRMPLEERPREGFLVYSHRVAVTDEMIPQWARPYTMISMSNPRMPEELAPLYQRARGLVVFEGTGSVLDAQMCGCPVVGIPNEQFRRNESSGHFGNAGFGWGTDAAELEWAERTLGIFQRNYRAHAQAFPSELAACIQEALAFFD